MFISSFEGLTDLFRQIEVLKDTPNRLGWICWEDRKIITSRIGHPLWKFELCIFVLVGFREHRLNTDRYVAFPGLCSLSELGSLQPSQGQRRADEVRLHAQFLGPILALRKILLWHLPWVPHRRSE